MNEPVTEVIEGGIIRVIEDGIHVDPVKEEVVGGKGADDEGGVPLTSQCSVCTAPAAEHRHYGAVSCYSCRAFFRRGAPKKVRCIFGHNQCQIDQHNRTNCKVCRYQRCIAVGMRPDKVNKYLNRRKEREAMIARCGGLLADEKNTVEVQSPSKKCVPANHRTYGDLRQQESIKQEALPCVIQDKCNDRLGNNAFKDETVDTDYKICPKFALKQSLRTGEELSSCNEAPRPPDMQTMTSVIVMRPPSQDDVTIIKYEQPIISSTEYKLSPYFTPKYLNESGNVHPATMEDGYSSRSPDSSTTSSCSSVIRFASSKLGRCEVGVLKLEESEENKEATVKTIKRNPVLPFTLEEEFKVIDFIVRLEDYIAKRFIFIDKNFGDNTFPDYSQLTMANAVCTKISGKLPYNPVMEERFFNLALKFTQLNLDHLLDDMRCFNAEMKINMLQNTFPSTYIIYYAMMENSNWMQPHSLGQEKVRKVRRKDMERFTSPWAIDYADEVKFEQTVSTLGEVLGGDTKLQALYTMLLFITPWQKQVPDALLLGLQASVSQLIYRYLASEEGVASADRKTRLLLSLVQHIHTAAHIMQYRTRRHQHGNTARRREMIQLLNNQEKAPTET